LGLRRRHEAELSKRWHLLSLLRTISWRNCRRRRLIFWQILAGHRFSNTELLEYVRFRNASQLARLGQYFVECVQLRQVKIGRRSTLFLEFFPVVGQRLFNCLWIVVLSKPSGANKVFEILFVEIFRL